MPCRPPFRPAVNDAHLCISDDFLSDAWNRFFRHSKAHHSGRRYGSRVPGPLEARSRLARRRMGLSVGLPGGGAEFGALFGFGGYGGRQFDPRTDLKWKPPGVEKVKKDEHWLFPKSAKRKVDIFDDFLAVEADVNDAKLSREELDEMLAEKDVRRSGMAGADNGKTTDTKRMDTIMPDDLKDVFAFLQSARDEPAAHNTLRLCEWLATKPTSPSTVRALAALIIDKIRLRTLDDTDIANVMAALMKLETRHTLITISILDAMPHATVQNVACSVIQRLFETSFSNYTPSDALLDWLLCLRRSLTFRASNTADTWRRVHALLAACFPRPASLVSHLRRFNEANLCDVLLEHWVVRMRPRRNGECAVLQKPYSKIFRYMVEKPDVDAIRATYTSLLDSRSAIRAGNRRHLAHTVHLLDALVQHHVPPVGIAEAAFTILGRGHGAPTVYSIFHALQRHPTIGVPWVIPAQLVRQLSDSKSKVGLAYAQHIFLKCPWVPLSSCPNLPLALAKAGKAGARRLWEILRRQTPEDHVQRSLRSIKFNRLRIDHCDLVHRVALEIANCKLVRPRVALRRVWECYRFLNDRGAYIRPSMTSALVTAGIMRYLEIYKRPPVEVVRFILSVVRKVEGEEVATKLDRVVLMIWENDVFPMVKAIWRRHANRVRKGLEEAVEDLSIGKRFEVRPMWAKPKREKSFHDTRRVETARRDWNVTIGKAGYTPIAAAGASSFSSSDAGTRPTQPITHRPCPTASTESLFYIPFHGGAPEPQQPTFVAPTTPPTSEQPPSHPAQLPASAAIVPTTPPPVLQPRRFHHLGSNQEPQRQSGSPVEQTTATSISADSPAARSESPPVLPPAPEAVAVAEAGAERSLSKSELAPLIVRRKGLGYDRAVL